MAQFIEKPGRIQAAGNKIKIIEEYIGAVNSRTADVSVAVMTSPEGWSEPGQTPEFDEISLVLEGALHAELEDSEYRIGAGQALLVRRHEWIRYSTPDPGGARYVSICLPAFTPESVHRDE